MSIKFKSVMSSRKRTKCMKLLSELNSEEYHKIAEMSIKKPFSYRSFKKALRKVKQSKYVF